MGPATMKNEELVPFFLGKNYESYSLVYSPENSRPQKGPPHVEKVLFQILYW